MSKQNGFTLTELLVVVVIIVVLGIAILIGINPMAQIFKGYDARRKSDLNKIKIALENYYADKDCYPVFPLDAVEKPTYFCESDFLSPYLAKMPCDPNSKKPYTVATFPDQTSCPQQYAVYAQIYSFFDKNANSIPYCPDTISVNSTGVTDFEISYGCSGKTACTEEATFYGCINGACVPVSYKKWPSCGPNYCESPTCDADPIYNPSPCVDPFGEPQNECH